MAGTLEEQIARAAEVLKAAGAREVYVFGSAAKPRGTPPRDVDLAVRGLPPEVSSGPTARPVTFSNCR